MTQTPRHTNRKEVLRILRSYLDRGQAVEIEGLGTFVAAADGHFDFVAQKSPRIFLAYVEEDWASVHRLAGELQRHGFSPWVDKDKLLPGQNWPRAIQRAIERADLFIPVFSKHSVIKKGQFQSELRYALDCALRLPLESVFVLPVRIDECDVPSSISQRVQYVDLFPSWKQGIRRLCATVDEASRLKPKSELRFRR
jgi:hypothetical protein